MEQAVNGHTWAAPPGTAPALVNATRAVWTARAARPRRNRNPYWVLDYSLSDMGLYRAGRHTRPWQRHAALEALLYPPGSPYWEDLRACRPPIRNAWLLFRGGERAGLAARVPPGAGAARFLDAEGRLGACIEQAVAIGQRAGDAGYWAALGCLCAAIDLLLGAAPAGPGVYRIVAADGRAAPGFAEEVNACLRERLGGRLTLAALAARLHVSVSGLSHRYRAETGESPIAALRRLRVEQARSLLLKGQPLKAIAGALGFGDVPHLSKTFSRLYGCSPRAFRRGRYAPSDQRRRAASDSRKRPMAKRTMVAPVAVPQ